MAQTRVLVVFVDALGPEQLATAAGFASLPHRRALRGVLGYTSGALATVLTGAEPADHGRMCLFSAKPGAQAGILAPLAWLGLLPRVLHERSVVRRVVARALARYAGLTGYVALHRVPPSAFRWLDLPERDDLFTAEAIGGVTTFLADARRAGLSVYAAPWQLDEAARWEQAHAEIARRSPDLTFLYAAKLDAALHRDGPGSEGGAAILAGIATHIARAREMLARDGAEVTTFVVGDHGMAEIRRVVDPRPFLPPAGRARAFVDSTMLRLWGDERALGDARRALERDAIPGRWLDGHSLAERHVPTSGQLYGEAIFLLDEGTLFAPSFVGGRVKGMHGYDVDTASAHAALASDTPLPATCVRLADLAGVVRERLGLTP